MGILVLYLDVVWILNLLIDACLLKLTALMLKRRMSRVRFWLGALTASSIVLLLFSPFAVLVAQPFGKLLFSALIIAITFGFSRLSVFIQNLAAFYFTAFAIGGGLFALHYFFQDSSLYSENHFLTTMSYGDPISWIAVVTGFPLLWFFSKKRLDQTAVRKWRSANGAKISVRIIGSTVHARGIIDSGNHLHDPLTGTPVMFMQYAACREILPPVFAELVREEEPFNLPAGLTDEWKSRLTWIPYRSVDGQTKYRVAIRPDQVLVAHEGKLIECRRALIALTEHTLSTSGDFDSILHPDMLLHGKIIEPAS